MLTAEAVRKALDLLPFEGFARRRQKVADDRASEGVVLGALRHRQTGRSTRMICSVLAAISSGRPVSIYAKPQSVEYELKNKAQEWAVKLGLNPKLVFGHLASVAEIEFFDHTWYDCL